MRSLKELMTELGFNKDADYETQKAFIKHLMLSANQTGSTKVLKNTDETFEYKVKSSQLQGDQLEFNFIEDKNVS